MMYISDRSDSSGSSAMMYISDSSVSSGSSAIMYSSDSSDSSGRSWLPKWMSTQDFNISFCLGKKPVAAGLKT